MPSARQPATNGSERTPPDPVDLAPHLRRRRARIIDAALSLLEHNEYDAIQIREVAEQADVALGTLYRYFSSKEHLYAAVLVEWSTDFDRGALQVSKGATDEERIRSLLTRAVRAFERRPQVFRAQIAIEASADPNARALYEQFASRYIDALLSSMNELSPSDAATIVQVMNSVLSNQLRSWALGRSTIAEVRHTIDAAITLVLHGPTGGS